MRPLCAGVPAAWKLQPGSPHLGSPSAGHSFRPGFPPAPYGRCQPRVQHNGGGCGRTLQNPRRQGLRRLLHLPRNPSQGRGPSVKAQQSTGGASRAALALCRCDVAWAVGIRCLLGVVVWKELATQLPTHPGCALLPYSQINTTAPSTGLPELSVGSLALCLLVYKNGLPRSETGESKKNLRCKVHRPKSYLNSFPNVLAFSFQLLIYLSETRLSS